MIASFRLLSQVGLVLSLFYLPRPGVPLTALLVYPCAVMTRLVQVHKLLDVPPQTTLALPEPPAQATIAASVK